MIPPLPPEVINYVRKVFRTCDRELGLRIARVPGVHETSLDMALIDRLAAFASPAVVTRDWTVRIDTHFLGGRRHFHSWEVADIGLLVYVRTGGKIRAQKVALFQSKRLYPSSGQTTVTADSPEDYYIGFGRLLPTKDRTVPLSAPARFRFTQTSKYRSLQAEDHQSSAIAEFQRARGVPVHYLLYNPWSVPAEFITPHAVPPALRGVGSAGTRVVPAGAIASLLSGKAPSSTPSFQEVARLGVGGRGQPGWRLPKFVADLVLGCKEGKLLEESDASTMRALFSDRTGPISAAIAIAIEGTDAQPSAA